MDDETTIAELTERVAMLEALVEKLAGEEPTTPPAPITPRSGGDDTTTASTPTTAGRPLPRRQMLGKAGAAAVGAVLGGAVAAVSTASPAAAATGSFDSSTFDPALTATNTGGGSAIHATATNGGTPLRAEGSEFSAVAIEVSGTPGFAGIFVNTPDTSMGVVGDAKDFGIFGMARSPTGTGVFGTSDGGLTGVSGTGENGATGVVGFSPDGVGAWAWGKSASLMLGPGQGLGDPNLGETPSPRTSVVAHQRGELVFDSNSDLWLCVADGTPGTWIHLGGPASSGTFTVLHRPVRVYNATAVTGIIHGIDLTTASSGVPTDATAAVITVNITNTTAQANSFCKVFADDLTTPPPTTAVRWRDAKELIANSVTTRLAAAKIATQINGQANLAIDVVGYYR
jgi:hypothetical protein